MNRSRAGGSMNSQPGGGANAASAVVASTTMVTPEPDLDMSAWNSMTRTLAHYERLEQIGEGTYGQVYRARCKDSGRIVAMKKMRIHHGGYWGMPMQLIREIKILKRLHHPRLLSMIEVVTSKGVEHLDADDPPQKSVGDQPPDKAADAREAYKGNLFLVLEYVEHDLTGLLDVAYKFEEVQIKSVFKQLLEALAYMHENKYVHRDIKSSNILLDSCFRLKLADFGLARCIEPSILEQMQSNNDRLASSSSSSSSVSSSSNDLTNKVITLWYRPPEILLGACQYGPAVDVWSAGCILAELLLGKPLFPGKSELETLNLIIDMLGTPSTETWEFFDQMKKSKALSSQTAPPLDLPSIRAETPSASSRLRDKYRAKANASALNLLEKLLEWDPRKRLTAANALQHSYFWKAPAAPDDPTQLGRLEVGPMGHFHEFQTKKKRKEAKAAAEKAKNQARTGGATEEQADDEYDKVYVGLMKKVVQEGIVSDPQPPVPALDQPDVAEQATNATIPDKSQKPLHQKDEGNEFSLLATEDVDEGMDPEKSHNGGSGSVSRSRRDGRYDKLGRSDHRRREDREDRPERDREYRRDRSREDRRDRDRDSHRERDRRDRDGNRREKRRSRDRDDRKEKDDHIDHREKEERDDRKRKYDDQRTEQESHISEIDEADKVIVVPQATNNEKDMLVPTSEKNGVESRAKGENYSERRSAEEIDNPHAEEKEADFSTQDALMESPHPEAKEADFETQGNMDAKLDVLMEFLESENVASWVSTKAKEGIDVKKQEEESHHTQMAGTMDILLKGADEHSRNEQIQVKAKNESNRQSLDDIGHRSNDDRMKDESDRGSNAQNNRRPSDEVDYGSRVKGDCGDHRNRHRREQRDRDKSSHRGDRFSRENDDRRFKKRESDNRSGRYEDSYKSRRRDDEGSDRSRKRRAVDRQVRDDRGVAGERDDSRSFAQRRDQLSREQSERLSMAERSALVNAEHNTTASLDHQRQPNRQAVGVVDGKEEGLKQLSADNAKIEVGEGRHTDGEDEGGRKSRSDRFERSQDGRRSTDRRDRSGRGEDHDRSSSRRDDDREYRRRSKGERGERHRSDRDRRGGDRRNDRGSGGDRDDEDDHDRDRYQSSRSRRDDSRRRSRSYDRDDRDWRDRRSRDERDGSDRPRQAYPRDDGFPEEAHPPTYRDDDFPRGPPQYADGPARVPPNRSAQPLSYHGNKDGDSGTQPGRDRDHRDKRDHLPPAFGPPRDDDGFPSEFPAPHKRGDHRGGRSDNFRGRGLGGRSGDGTGRNFGPQCDSRPLRDDAPPPRGGAFNN